MTDADPPLSGHHALPPASSASSAAPVTQNQQPAPLQAAQDAASDDELIAAWVAGGTARDAAFTRLYNRYRAPLYRYFMRQVNQASAHDCYQETWAKLIANLARYEARGTFQAYLFRLAHNVLMDQYRRDMRAPVSTDDADMVLVVPVDDAAATEAIATKAQLHDALWREIRKLPVNQRAVWVLRQETNLTLEQIAELTDTPFEAVKSRLRYASDKLKAGMQRYVE